MQLAFAPNPMAQSFLEALAKEAPRHPKEFLTVGGKPAWAAVVDPLDNAILHSVRYQHAEDSDFHHNFYLPDHMVAKINRNTAHLVWGDSRGLQSMIPMSSKMRQSLMPIYNK